MVGELTQVKAKKQIVKIKKKTSDVSAAALESIRNPQSAGVDEQSFEREVPEVQEPVAKEPFEVQTPRVEPPVVDEPSVVDSQPEPHGSFEEIQAEEQLLPPEPVRTAPAVHVNLPKPSSPQVAPPSGTKLQLGPPQQILDPFDEVQRERSPREALPSDLMSVQQTESGLDLGMPRERNVRGPSNTVLIGFTAFVAIFSFLVLAFMRGGEPEQVLSNDELRSAWESKRPSMMTPVALAAIDSEGANSYAETIIVGAAIRGEELPVGVDGGLIRIAFDERWERELSSDDRRLALTLALSGMLKSDTPRELPHLDRAHPGVLLAVTASAGENVSAILKNIPASLLAQLPPPFGPAFFELVRGDDKISCGDDPTRLLARLATFGIEGSDQVVAFVTKETVARLRVLAILFGQDLQQANKVLDILLNHPNIDLGHPLIEWARTWDLLSWDELESSDQLFVLAGIPPAHPVLLENVPKLFAHPLPNIRGKAIKNALEEIPFSHRGAFPILRSVAEQPEILTPKQTVELAKFLESPTRAKMKDVRAWLSRGVPESLLVELLASTAKETQATKFDFEISRKLQQGKWQPRINEMRKLSTHPDKLTRLYIYKKTYELADRTTARAILAQALKSESDSKFQQQLEMMIRSIDS